MSEAKTVYGLWNDVFDSPGISGSTGETADYFLRKYGHFGLIPGADAVVTEAGLEAGAKAMGDAFIDWGEVTSIAEQEARWEHCTRAALEAAGIVVADEVVEYPKNAWRFTADGALQASAPCTVFIKRSTSETGNNLPVPAIPDKEE